MRKFVILILFSIPMIAIILNGCKKEEAPEDKILSEEVNILANFKYYKNNTLYRLSSAQSAHNPYFKVRFNTIAYAALTDNGRLPAGGSFPQGSVVVSELYENNPGYIKLMAVMKKSNSPNAVNGWLWSEMLYDGSTAYSVAKKGGECVNCHSNNSRDQVRVFNQFP
jgi:hypothetical protein